jgi:hypothetical protein
MMPTREIDIQDCEKEVLRVFQGFVEQLRLTLDRTGEGCFEVKCATYTMRIRCGLGPWTDRGNSDLCVSVLPTKLRHHFSRNEASVGEIGIVAIARHFGKQCDIESVWTLGDFKKRAKQYLELVRDFGVQFLLTDETETFRAIQLDLDAKITAANEEAKKCRFIPGVQKRWHLPPPSETK